MSGRLPGNIDPTNKTDQEIITECVTFINALVVNIKVYEKDIDNLKKEVQNQQTQLQNAATTINTTNQTIQGLNQLISNLGGQLGQGSSSSGSQASKVKLAKPSKFDGADKEQAAGFKVAMTNYIETVYPRATADEQIIFIISFTLSSLIIIIYIIIHFSFFRFI